MQAPAATPVRAAAALAAAALAAALFIGMDATVKTLANRFDALQLTFLRFAAGSAFALPLWLWFRTPLPARPSWRLHGLRTVLLLLALLGWFHSLTLLPLVQAVAVGYTAPLFISLLAMVTLRERPSRWIWAALLLGARGRGHRPVAGAARQRRPRQRGARSGHARRGAVCRVLFGRGGAGTPPGAARRLVVHPGGAEHPAGAAAGRADGAALGTDDCGRHRPGAADRRVRHRRPDGHHLGVHPHRSQPRRADGIHRSGVGRGPGLCAVRRNPHRPTAWHRRR